MKKVVFFALIAMMIFMMGSDVYAANVSPGTGVSGNAIIEKSDMQDSENIEEVENDETVSESVGDDGQLILQVNELVEGLAFFCNLAIKLLFIITVLLAGLLGCFIVFIVFYRFF